jgi:hypothetical protein
VPEILSVSPVLTRQGTVVLGGVMCHIYVCLICRTQLLDATRTAYPEDPRVRVALPYLATEEVHIIDGSQGSITHSVFTLCLRKQTN